MKDELVEKFLDVCKAYVKEMDERVSYKKTNIEARAANALYGVYLDYSAIRRRFTKDDAKTALEIFKKYAKQAIAILSEMKEEHPELDWSFEKTPMSSALIGKSLFISNTEDIFPEFEYGNGGYMKMNENTKVTLTVSQLRKLVKESLDDFGSIDDVSEQESILRDLQSSAGKAIEQLCLIVRKRENDEDSEGMEAAYRIELRKMIDFVEEIKRFDALQ